jgi:hypothetical protein
MTPRVPIVMVVMAILVSFDRQPLLAVSPTEETVNEANHAENAGYLLARQTDPRSDTPFTAEPYYPQPGDILLYDSLEKWHARALKLAGSAPPSHSAIVIRRPTGEPAILEIGPNSRPMAFTEAAIVDVYPRLSSYPGTIMVRRPHQPLTPEQSEALTTFALGQDGKKFAVGRLVLQVTPFRCRTGLRRALFGRTIFDRKRWICSENVVAAATIAGLLDPSIHLANAMYPRDLAYDERYDLSGTYQTPVPWIPDLPSVDGVQKADGYNP